MNVYICQAYIEVGVNYPLSHHFQKRLGSALTERVKSSPEFLRKYSGDYDLSFYVSAKTKIPAVEIVGPTVYKKTKDVEYTIFIPFDRCARSDLPSVLGFLFVGIVMVLKKLSLDSAKVEADAEQIISGILSDPTSVREAPAL